MILMFITMKKFLELPSFRKSLYIETLLNLARARVLRSRTFIKVAPHLGEESKETPLTISSDQFIIKEISRTIDIMSKYTFWQSTCLVQAIAAMKMLEKRKIESTLYLGTARDEDGKMIAHAWLRSGRFYVTGRANMTKFTPVRSFAKFI